MIRRAESPADRQTCVEIFADVEPVDRITEEVLAASGGSVLLHDGGGYAYVTRSSVEDSALAMIRVRRSARRGMRAVNAGLGYREQPGQTLVEGWPL